VSSPPGVTGLINAKAQKLPISRMIEFEITAYIGGVFDPRRRGFSGRC
jgi:hypothetical protein